MDQLQEPPRSHHLQPSAEQVILHLPIHREYSFEIFALSCHLLPLEEVLLLRSCCAIVESLAAVAGQHQLNCREELWYLARLLIAVTLSDALLH